jgi:RND family efflux transporter MFP subunit
MGNPVRKDQIVMTFSQDTPSYQQARANYENARATYERMKNLFENKGISQQAFDNAKTQCDVAKANFKARDDEVNVKAPIEGCITRLDAQVSDRVRSGDRLFTVSNLNTVEARIWVSASEIGLVETGRPVSTEWLGRRFSGKISQVNLIMDPEMKAFLVLAEFDNPEHLLTSGITTDVSIETYRNEKALTVQRKEIIQEDDGPYAYVASSQNAEKRKLTIGRTQGLELEVLAGLELGDLLISEGSRQVRESGKILVVRTQG